MQSLVISIMIFQFSTGLCQSSNIDTIVSLTESHDFGEHNTKDEEYNFCIQQTQEKKMKQDIFGPFLKSVMEMSDVMLICSPCRYGSRPLPVWIKLTFENQQINLSSTEKYMILPNDSLLIKSARFEDFGTYYCLTNSYVGYIWSLEVEAYEDLEVVKAKQWKQTLKHFEQMTILTNWEHWSDCNKCDQIGKRHRMGYCFVQRNPTINLSYYKALDVYRSGLSCNLFLLIHPTAGQKLIALLAKSPIMMLGFCKISCEYFTANPAEIFSRLHPRIHEIYKEQIQRQSKEYYRDRIRKVKGILPGKPTRFEATVIILFLMFEFYIIIHVCKNRGIAQ